MIKKLKLRFIIVSLISVFAVLFIAVTSINVYNYVRNENESQSALIIVINNGFKEEQGPGGEHPDRPGDDNLMRQNYFLVSFDSNGNIAQYNFSHIFSISETEGKELATSIYNGTKVKGTVGNYKYLKSESNGYTYVACLDVKEKTESFNRLLLSSSLISLGGYLVLAGLIVLMSRIIFKTTEESYQKQKQFITNASHELKTPLTIISTDLDIIEMSYSKDEWTESIRDQVKRLTVMTNQLVTLSKLDENDLSRFPMEEFSISKIVEDCSDSFNEVFKSKNLFFSSEIEPNVVFNGNEYLINELIYILLDNASKYAKEGGEVSLSLKRNKSKIEIVSSNDIDDSEIDTSLLFERFYRSPSSVKKEGSGIGLSIAQEIVNIHKGKISASVENKKIKFLITF